MIALSLLPAAFYFTLRCTASRKRGYVVAAGVAWTLVGLSHNITYLYGVVFLGIFFASLLLSLRRQTRARFSRLVLAGVLHAALMLWYVVPQLMTLPHIEMHGQTATPMYASWLTPAEVIFSPQLTSHPDSTTPNLGLQVGWAVLGGAILSVIGILIPGKSRRRVRWLTLRLIVVFGLALFLAWSQVDVWQYLPKTFWFVQFPYRLLVFTTFFGSLLIACGLALCLGRRMNWPAAFVGVALVTFASGSYFPRTGRMYPGYAQDVMKTPPSIGGSALNDYLLDGVSASLSGFAHPDVDLARPEFGLTRGPDATITERALTGLNIPEKASGIRLTGVVPDDSTAAKLHITIDERPIDVPLSPGRAFNVVINLRQSDARALNASVLALSPRDARGGYARVRLASVRYVGMTAPAKTRLVTAAELKAQVKPGRVTKCRWESADPVILQLPVLFYPGLMRVEDKGQVIRHRNVGRLVAVELPPGAHRLEVRYIGATWANIVSGVGWLAVIASAVVAIRKRGKSKAAHPTGAPHPRLPVPFALASCGALLAGVGIAFGWTPVKRAVFGVPALQAVASRELSPEQSIDKAFDGKPATFWAAYGATPVRLTIDLGNPRQVAGLRLHARVTSLREAWHTVRATATLGEWFATDETIAMPQASTQDVVEARFKKPVRLDHLELTFSDPVLDLLAGGKVTPNVVNPGYTEIEIIWAD
jgi:hypothetical protein